MVNDPGYVIVSRAVAAGQAVSPVPGPSAPLAALAAVGVAARSVRLRRLPPTAVGGAPEVAPRSRHRARRSSASKRRAGSATCSSTLPTRCPTGGCASAARSPRCSRSSAYGRAADLATEFAERPRAGSSRSCSRHPADSPLRRSIGSRDRTRRRPAAVAARTRSDGDDARARAQRPARNEPQGGVRARAGARAGDSDAHAGDRQGSHRSRSTRGILRSYGIGTATRSSMLEPATRVSRITSRPCSPTGWS